MVRQLFPDYFSDAVPLSIYNTYRKVIPDYLIDLQLIAQESFDYLEYSCEDVEAMTSVFNNTVEELRMLNDTNGPLRDELIQQVIESLQASIDSLNIQYNFIFNLSITERTYDSNFVKKIIAEALNFGCMYYPGRLTNYENLVASLQKQLNNCQNPQNCSEIRVELQNATAERDIMNKSVAFCETYSTLLTNLTSVYSGASNSLGGFHNFMVFQYSDLGHMITNLNETIEYLKANDDFLAGLLLEATLSTAQDYTKFCETLIPLCSRFQHQCIFAE